jgi:hypothetical protein
MASHFMPFHGERGAPTFDHTNPNTIRQYFAQLEGHFARCKITSELEKKDYATQFVKVDIADTWEALGEYSNTMKTYAEFKNRLFEIYNQTLMRYTISDLDQLVSDYIRLDLRTRQALSDFYLRFNTISTFLLDLGLLSMREQSAMYLRGFSESLRTRIGFRLQIQYPHHCPSLPYSIDAIFEAAQWILCDPTIQSSISPSAKDFPVNAIEMRTPADKNENIATPMRSPVTPTSGADYIKTEQLNAMLTDVLKTIIDAICDNDSLQSSSMPSEQPATCAKTNTAISIPNTLPITLTQRESLSASYTCEIAPISIAPASFAVPMIPEEVQMRIQAIEEEICILRAQSKFSTVPIQSTTSANHSDAIPSTSNPLRDSTLGAKPPIDPIELASNSNPPASRLSCISNPATFVYHNRVYQAIHWTPKHRISTATSIPASQSTATIPISSALTCEHFPPNTTLRKIQISTSQPSDNAIAAIGTLPTLLDSISAPGISRELSMSSAILHIRFRPQTDSTAITSILRTSVRFLLRSIRKYIRNHARLKGHHILGHCATRFDFAPSQYG